jgi:hypothetical protein
MTDLRNANLASIRQRFRRTTELATRHLKHDSEAELGWLLRHHREAAITDEETWQRDSFDDLLSMYGLVEIACLIQAVPSPLPKRFANEARENLASPPLRRYYMSHYQTVLPRALLSRLDGATEFYDTSPWANSGFVAFLQLNGLIERDDPTNLFLWMLDGGRANGDGSHLGDLLDLLATERSFIEAMTRRRTRRSWYELRIDDALIGLERFLRFCRSLEQLLGDVGQSSLLRSEMWRYHGYWFRQLKRRAETRVRRAIQRFGAWEAIEVQDKEMKTAIKKSIEAMDRCLERLSSDEFARPLEEALRAANH